MKKVLLFTCLFACFFCVGQVSYDFLEPLPPGLPVVKMPKKKYHGTYQSFVSERTIEINENGIFVHNEIVSQVSRELVRESSNIYVIANFIYGVHETDSLPCYSDSTNYYFMVPVTESLYSDSTQHVLVRISDNTYVLNFYERGTYTPCLLTFAGKDLRVQYFDYSFDTQVFDGIKIAQERDFAGMVNRTLEPDIDEFLAMEFSQIFGKEILFKRAS